MRTSGSCLCKAVKFSFDIAEKHFNSCHCKMCRVWGGGPAMVVESAGGIEFESEEELALYDSSKWAERGFCKKCGSHLFYRLKNHPYCNFNLGTLDNDQEFTFKTQFYIDIKPHNYAFSNETKTMTEEEVMAAFNS
ncbi:MAG: GFA family protein [Halobacteriovoraceae bacterium]|jgi:hypothetical protein|nr:GFA family protein [Halobacteriovoraceae bacterium]MBT5094713.1 GFA family protein [Halobacteriovoraceae bacterium]